MLENRRALAHCIWMRNAPFALAFFAVSFVVTSALLANPPSAATYQLDIGGFYHGDGTGTIHGNSLDLNGNVTTDDGSTGSFVATGLHIKGNHFTGQGTVCGRKVTVDGRFDRPPGHGRGKTGAGRLVVTFSVDDGHDGRIVGVQN